MSARNPLDEVERFLRRLSRQFDAAELPRPGGLGGPAVDVVDRPDSYEVTVDLPGVETADVDLTLSGRTLSVSADRSVEPDGDATVLRRERRDGPLRRRIELPEAVAADEVEASLADGVLAVTVPKAGAGEGSRRIDID